MFCITSASFSHPSKACFVRTSILPKVPFTMRGRKKAQTISFLFMLSSFHRTKSSFHLGFLFLKFISHGKKNTKLYDASEKYWWKWSRIPWQGFCLCTYMIVFEFIIIITIILYGEAPELARSPFVLMCGHYLCFYRLHSLTVSLTSVLLGVSSSRM